jgi:hypothetical protein
VLWGVSVLRLASAANQGLDSATKRLQQVAATLRYNADTDASQMLDDRANFHTQASQLSKLVVSKQQQDRLSGGDVATSATNHWNVRNENKHGKRDHKRDGERLQRVRKLVQNVKLQIKQGVTHRVGDVSKERVVDAAEFNQ